MGVWDEFCAVCGGPSVFYPYENFAQKAVDLEIAVDLEALEQLVSYTLRFADLRMRRYNLVEGIEYGEIARYHDQDFDSLGMLRDGLAWMLHDPTQHERNRARIVAMWKTRPAYPAAAPAKRPAAKKRAN